MSGIKKHHAHNNGHHHLATFSRNGHSYTYLHCDSKDHHHASRHSPSKHKEFEQYLVAIDGVAVASTKSHITHNHRVKHKTDESAHHSHKKHKRLHASHHGGEAARIARKKAQKTLIKAPQIKASETRKTAPIENSDQPNTSKISQTTPANPASENSTPQQVQQNLAQLIAANSDSATRYPVGKDGKSTTDSSKGIAIIKNKETGKLEAYGEMLKSIELSSQDPANLSPEDKARIEAAIKSGDLVIGNLSEGATTPPDNTQKPDSNTNSIPSDKEPKPTTQPKQNKPESETDSTPDTNVNPAPAVETSEEKNIAPNNVTPVAK